jgi:Rad51
MSESAQVVALRRLLDARFPPVRPRVLRAVPTGVDPLDERLGGGLHTGTLTEFVSALPSGGSQLSVGSLLRATRLSRQRVALIDAAGGFDRIWSGSAANHWPLAGGRPTSWPAIPTTPWS